MKVNSIFKLLWISLCICLGSSKIGWSQLRTIYPNFSQTQSTYTPLSGGNLIIEAGTTSFDSWVSPAISIPAVYFMGETYTTAYVNSNGLLKLGGSAPTSGLTSGISTNPSGGGVHFSVFNADLDKVYSNGGTNIKWQLVGDVLVFQFTGFKRYNQTEEFNFQARIHIWGAYVAYSYDLVSGPGTGTSYFPQIGIATANTVNNYVNRLVANDATSSWIASDTGIANNSTCRFTSNTTNPKQFTSGLLYRWDKITCPTVTSIGNTTINVDSVCNGDTILVNVSNPSFGLEYQLQGSHDGVNFTTITNAIALPIETNAAYSFYRIRSFCIGSLDTVAAQIAVLNYKHKILTSQATSFCGIGTSTFTATAANNFTINWYESLTATTPIATGNSFVSPLLTGTTTYYAASGVVAPIQTVIGAGTSTGSSSPYNPFNGGYGGMKTQYIITADELRAAGLSAGPINSIGFEMTAGTQTYNDFSIEMGHTSLSEFSTTINYVGGLTLVKTPANRTNTVGVNTIALTTPFVWDGSSNIIISTCWSNNASSNGSSTIKYHTAPARRTQSIRINNVVANDIFIITGTSTLGSREGSTSRPNIFINGTSLCESKREPVTAFGSQAAAFDVTNNASLCNDEIKMLTVITGQADYNSVVWSPSTNLFTDAAATIPYVANTHAYTVYYKSNTQGLATIVANSSNNTTGCSNSDTVHLNVMPASIQVVADVASFCISGSTQLSIEPNILDSFINYQWQLSSDNVTFNDIAGETNNVFTTPVISNTSYYRVILKNSANQSCLTAVSDTVLINNPVIVRVTNDTICGIGTGQLTATVNGNDGVRWFESMTSNTVLSNSVVLNTPIISSTTQYFAEPYNTNPDDVQIGSGTLTSSGSAISPWSGVYGGIKTQYIIKASELEDAGIFAGPINSFGIDISTAGATTYQGLSVEMGHTTLNDFPTPVNIIGGLNLVKNPADFTPTVGWNNFEFNTPFVWDGSSNIIISISWSNNASTSTTSTVRYATYATNLSQTVKRDSQTPANMLATTGNTGSSLSRSTGRPNFLLNGLAICKGPRVAATVVVNPPAPFAITNDLTVCNNAVQPITVTTGLADFNQITWSPINGLYTDAAGTVPYTANTHATTVYLRTDVVGSNVYIATALNTNNNCKNVDTISALVLPGTLEVAAQNQFNCLSGQETISLVGTNDFGSATIQWQESNDNVTFTNIAGANNLTYVTPILTTNKYYRVALINNSSICAITAHSDSVVINNPTLSITNANQTICDSGSVLLTTVPAGNYKVNWYESLPATNPIFEGNSFTTPILTSNETYYVQPFIDRYDTVTVGTGTTTASSYPNPLAKTWGGSRHQYLFTAAELAALGLNAGPIKGLALDVATISTSGTVAQRTLNDFTIRIAPTTLTNMSAGVVNTTFQSVFNEPAGYLPTTTGWNYFNFATDYIWDGTSNLLVEFINNSGNTGAGGSHNVRYTATSFVSAYARWADNVLPATAAEFLVTTTTSGSSSTTSTRPNMKFYTNLMCEGPIDSITVNVNQSAPAVVTPAGNVGMCNGAQVVLSSVNSAPTYAWFKSGVLIANSNVQSITVTDTGKYILVTYSGDCIDTSDIVNVAYSPSPVFSLGADKFTCPNTPVVLSAPANLGTVVWEDNSVLPNRSVANPGTYIATITNNFGCTFSDTIKVFNYIHDNVDLGADKVICPSELATLSVTGYASVIWSTGDLSPTISVDSGLYSVIVTDINGCSSTDSVLVTYAPYASVNGFTFTPYFYEQQGKVQFNPINPNNVSDYYWEFGDGNTSTLRNPLHTYTQFGTYLVKLHVSNGICPAEIDSQSITINFSVGVEDVDAFVAKLYPNPATDQVTIEIDQTNARIEQLYVYDKLGRLNNVPYVIQNNQVVVNTSILTSGIYNANLQLQNGTIIRVKFEIIK